MSDWLDVVNISFIKKFYVADGFAWCLTQCGLMTHIYIGNLTIIGSDNGLLPGLRQAFIWTNDGILLIGPLGTNFREILIEIHMVSLIKFIWKCHLQNVGHFVSASMC